MSDLLVIGTAQPPDSLRQRLEQEVAAFTPLAAACGLEPPQLSEYQCGNWFFLAVQGPALPGRRRNGPLRGGSRTPAGPAAVPGGGPGGTGGAWEEPGRAGSARPGSPGPAASWSRMAAELRYDFGGLFLGGPGWFQGPWAQPPARPPAGPRPAGAMPPRGRPVPPCAPRRPRQRIPAPPASEAPPPPEASRAEPAAAQGKRGGPGPVPSPGCTAPALPARGAGTAPPGPRAGPAATRTGWPRRNR